MPGAPITVPGPVPNKAGSAPLTPPLFGYIVGTAQNGGTLVGTSSNNIIIPVSGLWRFLLSNYGNANAGAGLSVVTRRMQKNAVVVYTITATAASASTVTFPDGTVVTLPASNATPSGGDQNFPRSTTPTFFDGLPSLNVAGDQQIQGYIAYLIGA